MARKNRLRHSREEMKMQHFTLIILFFFTIVCAQASIDLRKVYENVDREIDRWPEYRERRQARIDSLRNVLFTKDINWTDTQFVKCLHLIDEYQCYQNDSALYYIKMLEDISTWTSHATEAKATVKIALARQAVRSGMYEAALSYLHEADTTQISQKAMAEYFRVRHFAYIEMSAYCYIWSKRQEYLEQAHLCRQRLSSLLGKNSQEWLMNKAYDELLEDHYREAERLSDLCLQSCPRYSDLYRQAAFHRRFICESLKQEDEACYWQAESAISELRLGITDQVGLWSLASKMSPNELNRQYRYIRFSWDVISTFGKNARTWQVAPVLSAVEHQYQHVRERQHRIILTGAVVLLIFGALLALAYFYVSKKRHQLAVANEKLADYNVRLTTANVKLADANRIKERYIVQLLEYNSEFIDAKEETRRTLSKMFRTGKVEELAKLLNAADKSGKEIGSLLSRFDDIFLELYPSFIDDFNALLQEEGRIIPNRKERMNTPLRIFALLRLGIDNTQDVAKILHCSAQTVYNYRNSIRNAYLHDRNRFEEAVKSIGIDNQLQQGRLPYVFSR